MGKVWSTVYIACILCGVVLISGYGFAWAGVPAAPSDSTMIDNTLAEIDQVKALLGVIIILFGGNMWWTRRYVNQNDAKWKTNWDHHREYDDLKTRHDVMMEMAGNIPHPTPAKSPPIKHYSTGKGK